jgi:hypothetical protein
MCNPLACDMEAALLCLVAVPPGCQGFREQRADSYGNAVYRVWPEGLPLGAGVFTTYILRAA